MSKKDIKRDKTRKNEITPFILKKFKKCVDKEFGL
jgi:hypothetical protein